MNINLTLIAQAVAFALFIWFSVNFVWPPLMRAIDTRQKTIADGLAAADEGRKALDRASQQTEAELKAARERASVIVGEAQKQAAQLIEEAKVTARAEGERLVAGARGEIEQEITRARETLREQVATLAVAGAEKILRREVDSRAHSELLSALRQEL